MQENESIMVVQCELKILSLGITSASLSKPHDAKQLPLWRNFQSAPSTIKVSYILNHTREIIDWNKKKYETL